MIAALTATLAFAEDLPDRYVGRYIPENMAEALVTGDFLPSPGHRQLDVGPQTTLYDYYVDTREAPVDPADFSIEGERYLRLDDVAPSMLFYDNEELRSAVALGHGWEKDGVGHIWYSVVGSDEISDAGKDMFLRRGLVESTDSGGGWGFNNSMLLDGVEYVLSADDQALVLEEAAEQDGPDLEVLEGGRTLTFTAFEDPAFRVLTPSLNIRASPSVKGRGLGTIGALPWVRVVARTAQLDEHGGIKAHWYLVQGPGVSGWAWGVYLGQRVAPVGGGKGLVTVHPEVWPDDWTLQYGEASGEVGCEVRKGDRRAAPEGGPDRANEVFALISDVGADGKLDVLCAYHHGDKVEVCPLLWSDETSVWESIGCAKAPSGGEPLPKLWMSDKNNDGKPDLSVGDPANPYVVLYDDFKTEPEVIVGAVEDLPAVQSTTEATSSSGATSSWCATASVLTPAFVWLFAAGLIRRRR